MIPASLHPNINQLPSTYPIPPVPSIICNNNTVDITFLVQMRQSKKSESEKNDEIFVTRYRQNYSKYRTYKTIFTKDANTKKKPFIKNLSGYQM